MNPKALTTRELDDTKCGRPGCTTVHPKAKYLHAGCHPGKGVHVRYEDGVLEITCATCSRGVTRVAVATGLPS